MLKMKIIGLPVLMLTMGAAQAAHGSISVKGAVSVKEKISRLEISAREKSLVIFARIDNAAGAQKFG
jgi:uncharacterized protein (DUF302 family)